MTTTAPIASNSRPALRARALVGLLVALLVGLLPGCTPWATWPPIEGAAGISNPSLNPIPELMAGGIRATAPDADPDANEAAPVIFNLPPNTPAQVYMRVGRLVGGAEPMTDAWQDALHVTAVRLRSVEAEVDIVRTGLGGVPELVTVAMKHDLLKGWRPVRERVWHIRVDLPEPNYPNIPGDTATADAFE